MLVKGLIKTINFNDNSCRVRIPVFETAASQGEVVVDAIMLIQPGLYNGYTEGDVVFVDFENDLLSQPVVIGKLYLGAQTENKAQAHSALTVANLKVSSSVSLPIDTQLVLEDASSLISVDNGITSYKSLTDVIKALYKTESSVGQAVKDQSETIAKIVVEYLSQPADQETPTADNANWQPTSPVAEDNYTIWQKTTCYNHRGQVLNTEIICLTTLTQFTAPKTTYYALIHNKYPDATTTVVAPSPTDETLPVKVKIGTDNPILKELKQLNKALEIEDPTERQEAINKAETWGDWSTDIPAHTDYTNSWNFWITTKTHHPDGTISFSTPSIDQSLSNIYALAQGKTTNYYSSEDPSSKYTIKEGDCWFYSSNNKPAYSYTPVSPPFTEEDPENAYIGYYVQISAEPALQYILVTSDNIDSLDVTPGTTTAYSRSVDEKTITNSTLYQWVGNSSDSPAGTGRWQDVGDELIANKVTAKYINALDITAKKIKILDTSNSTLFEADGLSKKPTVTIGGFTVNANSITSEDKTDLNSTGAGVYLGSDGISIGNGFFVSVPKGSANTTMRLSPEVSEQISAVTYWLASSCVVHTGTKYTEPIVITAKKKIGAASETMDPNAVLWWKYASDTRWKPASPSPNLLEITAPSDANIQVLATHNSTFDPNGPEINITTDINIYEREEITFSPLNTPVLDLSNDSAAIAYNGTTKVDEDDIVETTATLYLNGTEITEDVSYSWNLTGCEDEDERTSTTGKILKIKYLTANTATAVCTASCTNEIANGDYTKVFTITKQLKGEPGQDGVSGASPIILEIENDFDSIPCDYEGNPSYTNEQWLSQTTHILRLFEGTTAASFVVVPEEYPWLNYSDTDYVITYSSEGSPDFDSNSLPPRFEASTDPYTGYITGVHADNSKINYKVYKPTSESVLATGCFTAEKRKAGEPNTDYYIVLDSTQFKYDPINSYYSPESISCTFYKQVGNNTPEILSKDNLGGLKFYCAENDTKYSGLPDTGQYDIEPFSDTMRIQLYLRVDETDETKDILLDTETISVVQDGYPGTDGQDGATGRSVLSTIKYYTLATNLGSEVTKPPVAPEMISSGWYAWNEAEYLKYGSSGWINSPPAYKDDNGGNVGTYYESVCTIYDTTIDNPDWWDGSSLPKTINEYSWSDPVQNSMLSVDFIDSLGITTKKISVLADVTNEVGEPTYDDNGKRKQETVFEVDGFATNGSSAISPTITLGGWIIEKDGKGEWASENYTVTGINGGWVFRSKEPGQERTFSVNSLFRFEYCTNGKKATLYESGNYGPFSPNGVTYYQSFTGKTYYYLGQNGLRFRITDGNFNQVKIYELNGVYFICDFEVANLMGMSEVYFPYTS